MSPHASQPSTTLRGRWLVLARVAWSGGHHGPGDRRLDALGDNLTSVVRDDATGVRLLVASARLSTKGQRRARVDCLAQCLSHPRAHSEGEDVEGLVAVPRAASRSALPCFAFHT